MAKRKTGLSRDEHAQLGAELAAMRSRLMEITVQLGHAYPRRMRDLASRVQSDLGRLRSKLDDAMFDEYPAVSTAESARVYYPG